MPINTDGWEEIQRQMASLRAERDDLQQRLFNMGNMRTRNIELADEVRNLRRICGEAADRIHLSELPGPEKMSLYKLLCDAANGLLGWRAEDRRDPSRAPRSGMIWSDRWKMWLDPDTRTEEEKARDEKIAGDACEEAL